MENRKPAGCPQPVNANGFSIENTMMDTPTPLLLLFTAATVFALMFFIFSAGFGSSSLTRRRTNATALLVLGWTSFMATLSLNGYFRLRDATPPKLAVIVIAWGIALAVLFNLSAGKRFIDGMSTFWLTLIHTVRVPVEICLWWLATYKLAPEMLTFEGYNVDIFTGITAPLMAWLSLYEGPKIRLVLKIWNAAGLIFLLNLLVTALLSLPSPMQQLNADQPLVALNGFPYAWLPTVIMPLLVFAHLAMLRRLWSATATA